MAQLNRGTFTEWLLPASLPRGSSASNLSSSSSSSSSSWPPASAFSRRLPEPRETPGQAPGGAWLKAARCARAPRQLQVGQRRWRRGSSAVLGACVDFCPRLNDTCPTHLLPGTLATKRGTKQLASSPGSGGGGFPVWALASNFPPSETIHIAQFPPYHTFGKMILLFLDDPRSPPACNWFLGRDQSKESHILRGQSDPVSGYYRIKQTGPAFMGWEDVERGCSFIIQNVQDSDAGPYTVSMMGLGGKDHVTGMRNLQLSYDIPNPTNCSWFRGKDQREEGRIFRAKFSRTSHSYLIDQKGAAHRGREKVWRGCALVIRNVEASDAGPHTISMGDEWDAYPIMAWRELRVSCKCQRWGLRRCWKRIECGA